MRLSHLIFTIPSRIPFISSDPASTPLIFFSIVSLLLPNSLWSFKCRLLCFSVLEFLFVCFSDSARFLSQSFAFLLLSFLFSRNKHSRLRLAGRESRRRAPACVLPAGSGPGQAAVSSHDSHFLCTCRSGACSILTGNGLSSL